MNNTVLKDLLTILVEDDEDSSDDDFLNLLMESSDEEEILTKLLQRTAPRKLRTKRKKYLDESVSKYTDDEFMELFRISREGFSFLCKRLQESDLYTKLRPDKKLSSAKYVAVFLFFSGKETISFRHCSERFGLAQSSVCRIINRVTNFFSGLANDIIVWPDEKRKLEISEHFKKKYGIRGVIGAISVTRIVIEAVKGEYSDEYKDSDGHVSISLQAVCDEKGKFLDVFIGFPGSAEESSIFKNSFIYPDLNKLCNGYYIVADSNYPCMKNLLTPYTDKIPTFAQKLYNRQLESCRNVIDNTFKEYKERFGQLRHCKLKGIKKLCHFIRACCVLHNIAIEYASDSFKRNQGMGELINAPSDDVSESEAKAARDAVCEDLIARPKDRL